ncbi:MAG: hypothetical protein MUF43_03360 [Flavobacterium sp.]|nr:hypothetical protein [Flavobacterium sp.]
MIKKTNRQNIMIPAAQMAHLVLPDTQANPSAKAKEPFFSKRTNTANKTLNKVIFFNLTD